MRAQVTAAISSVTTTPPVQVSYDGYFNLGFGVVITGTATFKVQHCYDTIGDGTNGTVTAANATWFDHPTVTGKTANTDGSYVQPIQYVRLNCTAWTSGTLVMTVVSAGR
jgi:hypothetical protein